MRSQLAEARNDNASPREGEVVGGRYRVEGVIGTGGMGRVVAARDEAGRQVAVKLLLSPPSERVWVERFFREARAVSRINSAHVVKVISVSDAEEETPFIVMERLRGRDYGKRLRAEGPLTLRDVADCIVQACDALACSHHVGVVHRDVKPSNLFDHTNPDGSRTLKVLDFGISKARGQEEFEHTLTTSRDGMLGSPPYMSPEHIRDARSVDHRTDIWSLGVVAYQLLAGRLPFDGQSVGEVFCSVLERRFSPLSKVRPDLPREIEAIINKCLSREPGERYQTAADMARAFLPWASPRVAALVAKMPTSVPAPTSGTGPAAASRETPIPGMGKRIDGELHTITLPPVGTAEVSEITPNHGELPMLTEEDAAATEPTIGPTLIDELETRAGGISPVISIPRLLPHEDLSAASIAAAKRMRQPRRSMALAAGVAILMFGLMAIPYALSSPSASTKAANRDVPPVTAVPMPAAAPPSLAAPESVGAASPPAVPNTPIEFVAPATNVVPTETPTAVAPLTAAEKTPTTKSATGVGQSRIKRTYPQPRPTTKTTHQAAAPTPPAAEPKVEETKPKPKPPSELHPNPYGDGS